MDSMQITEPIVMPSELRGLVWISSAHSLIVSRWKMPAKGVFHRKAQALVSGRAKTQCRFIIGEKGVVILAVFKIERACHKGTPMGGGKV